MNEQWCSLVQQYLEDIRGDVKDLKKSSAERQVDCVRNFASKSYVKRAALVLLMIIILAMQSPNAPADAIKVLKGVL